MILLFCISFTFFVLLRQTEKGRAFYEQNYFGWTYYKRPAIRYMDDGKAMLRLTLAVQRPYKNKEGRNEADFINCSLWNKVAETVGNYCGKGSMIGITGRLQSRSYLDDKSVKINVTEVVVDSVSLVSKSTKKNQEPSIIKVEES